MGIVCARAGAQPWSRGCVGDCALLLYALLVVSRGCCDDVPCLSWTISGHTRLVITYPFSANRQPTAVGSPTLTIHQQHDCSTKFKVII